MPKLSDDIGEEYVRKPDYWSKFIVLLIIGLNILFVLEILDIFRTMESEPYALIGLVSAVSVGQYSIIYFVLKKGETIVRESIRYERDYEERAHFMAHEKDMQKDEQEMATDEQEYDVKMATDERKDVEFCPYEEIGIIR